MELEDEALSERGDEEDAALITEELVTINSTGHADTAEAASMAALGAAPAPSEGAVSGTGAPLPRDAGARADPGEQLTTAADTPGAQPASEDGGEGGGQAAAASGAPGDGEPPHGADEPGLAAAAGPSDVAEEEAASDTAQEEQQAAGGQPGAPPEQPPLLPLEPPRQPPEGLADGERPGPSAGAGPSAEPRQQPQKQEAQAAATAAAAPPPAEPRGTRSRGASAGAGATLAADAAAAAADAAALQRPSAPEPSPYFVAGLRGLHVEVDCGPGVPCRLVRVEVDVSEPKPKPFLGGFKHRGSGATYHHALTQTPPAAPPPAAPPRACRETQTVTRAARCAQTLREAATQMPRPGAVIDASGDRELTPRVYVTAREVLARREAAALTVQRFARGWAARARAAGLRGDKAEREAFLAAREARRANEAEDTRRRQVERRMHPVKRSDFRVLEAELEAWRRHETGRIKAAGLDAAREQEALRLLLAKETRLLQTIDRLRVNARHEAHGARADQALGAMAAPKTWELRNGAKVAVTTPATARAGELRQLHRGLGLASLTVDERLDLLLHVKWTAKEFDCGLTREIVQLVDREADLLNRGRSPAAMEGLRRRLAGLFLEFCESPAFNPEAAGAALLQRGGGGGGGCAGVPSGVGAAAAAAAAAEVFIYAEAERAAARAAPVAAGGGAGRD